MAINTSTLYHYYTITKKSEIMAKNRFKYVLLSYNRYTDSYYPQSTFRTLKSAKMWMWDEELDWLHMGYCVQKKTSTSIELKDDMGNIAAYRIERIAA